MNQQIFKQYQRTQIAELRPYNEGDDISHVSIAATDLAMGSPKPGDMIARNPNNHNDQWLVNAKYFSANFSEIDDQNNSSEIHPAPDEFPEEQIAANPILRFFHYKHLPGKLRATSESFCRLAHLIVHTLPRNAERSVALRKLLEAKDAAVRSNLGGI